MQTVMNSQQETRIETLKQLYIGKCEQISKTNASLNCLKYQILQAELLMLKSAIPAEELPL